MLNHRLSLKWLIFPVAFCGFSASADEPAAPAVGTPAASPSGKEQRELANEVMNTLGTANAVTKEKWHYDEATSSWAKSEERSELICGVTTLNLTKLRDGRPLNWEVIAPWLDDCSQVDVYDAFFHVDGSSIELSVGTGRVVKGRVKEKDVVAVGLPAGAPPTCERGPDGRQLSSVSCTDVATWNVEHRTRWGAQGDTWPSIGHLPMIAEVLSKRLSATLPKPKVPFAGTKLSALAQDTLAEAGAIGASLASGLKGKSIQMTTYTRSPGSSAWKAVSKEGSLPGGEDITLYTTKGGRPWLLRVHWGSLSETGDTAEEIEYDLRDDGTPVRVDVRTTQYNEEPPATTEQVLLARPDGEVWCLTGDLQPITDCSGIGGRGPQTPWTTIPQLAKLSTPEQLVSGLGKP